MVKENKICRGGGMVDTGDSKSPASNSVRVQVPSSAPLNTTSNIDISLIESNLSLSPSERLMQHQSALDLVLELDKARVNLNAKSQQSA